MIKAFFSEVKQILIQCFTGKDGQTTDVGRILWAVATGCAVIYSGFVVWHTKSFDIVSYGTGIGALLAGGGAALKLKESTEP